MAKPNIISKQDLIESAKRCIVEQGINKLTLQAVAKGANVTQGTVYYHFQTKEQLMMDIVRDVCLSSRQALQDIKGTNDERVKTALQLALSRTQGDKFYHQLFLSLVVNGLQKPELAEELSKVITYENKFLTEQLHSYWSSSPVAGVSMENWGIIFNALIDGVAIQALLDKEFPLEDVFESIGRIFYFFNQIAQKGNENQLEEE